MIERPKDFIVKGVTASGGIAIGRAQLLHHEEIHLQEHLIEADQVDVAFTKFESAIQKVKDELNLTREIAKEHSNEEADLILETQLQILDDPELLVQSKQLISDELYPADRAVWSAFQMFIDVLEQSRNEFMMQRLPDIREIRDRLVRSVQQQHQSTNLKESAILVADWVSPSEVVLAYQSGIKAILSNQGGLTSHASIIANAMEIPMIIGLKAVTRIVHDGDIVIVDAVNSKAILNPSFQLVRTYKELELNQIEQKKARLNVVSRPNEMLCGKPFTLRANLEFAEEAENVKRFSCDGVGLLRTESLLLTDGKAITEQGQIHFYSQILANTEGAVTIRLFDIGGDKLPGRRQVETNPFLGERGIRFLLSNPDLMGFQLRAILTVANKFPNRVKILVPMVAVLEEWFEFTKHLHEVANSMEGISENLVDSIPLGAMVEVPSLIVQADLFSKYVDFFSIGTNDLTQYIMASDRGNPLVSSLYDTFQPAVFKAIRWMRDAAKRNNKPLAVCGEAASNPVIALALMGLGISELSMTPRSIPEVKRILTEYSVEQAEVLANRILACETASQVHKIAGEYKVEKV